MADIGLVRGIADTDDEFWQAKGCHAATGIPEGTWRYWAHTGQGPASFKLGRRRVWRKSVVMEWIKAQESEAGAA